MHAFVLLPVAYINLRSTSFHPTDCIQKLATKQSKMFVQFDLLWKMVAKVCHDAIKVGHCMHFRVGLELINRTAFSTSFQAVGGTWIHMVLNYIGPENGHGFQIHYNEA